jgi:hypothetical protein
MNQEFNNKDREAILDCPGSLTVGNRADCYCLITVLKGARMQKLLKVLGLTLLLLSFAAVSYGQAVSGDLVGTVTDKTGAVVANAQVDVQNDHHYRARWISHLQSPIGPLRHICFGGWFEGRGQRHRSCCQ